MTRAIFFQQEQNAGLFWPILEKNDVKEHSNSVIFPIFMFTKLISLSVSLSRMITDALG